ncbi:MAG: glycine cleavage system aminomethyltransferase GcvT [Pseudomonadota bacterium]
MSPDKSDDKTGEQVTLRTPLYDLHVELGGKMVPFAGYELPIQYPAGIMTEHKHTRAEASLFDVSHMGQVRLDGDDRAAALEAILPADVQGIKPGAIRYSFFTSPAGGILDDLMITNGGDCLYLVVNGACKVEDLAHLRRELHGKVEVTELSDLALVALQGPKAAAALAQLAPGVEDMAFMTVRDILIDGVPCRASRSGYSGEDGYEISIPADKAEQVARRLLAQEGVAPAGLGARDSLRLEAGLCLYGHDIDTTTTPVEAALTWAIQKRRREEGGFPGADIVQDQLANGAPRKRVGLKPLGRAPIREGVSIVNAEGANIGTITSGGFGPTAGGPVAMGYVASAYAAEGTEVACEVRGKILPCQVVKLPFVKPNYYRG